MQLSTCPRLIFFISLIIAINTAGGVVAAEKKKIAKPSSDSSSRKAKWQQEPSSFMGLELFQPLSKSVTSECPKGTFGTVDSSAVPSGALCHNDFILKEVGSYTVYGFEVKPINREVYVKTLNMKLEDPIMQVQTDFNSRDFSEIKQMFTLKYGAPHKVGFKKLKTKGGAEFDNVILTWSGDKVTIKIESLHSRGVDSSGSIYELGVIEVYTSDYLNKTKQERDAAAHKNAAGL